MQAGKCGNQMGTKFGRWCATSTASAAAASIAAGSDTIFERNTVLYNKASGGKCAPCAVLFDLEPGVIGAVTLSRRSSSFTNRKIS
jgi:hypothetical protein